MIRLICFVVLMMFFGCTMKPKSTKVFPMFKEPSLEWKSCTQDNLTLGLNDHDFMLLQMYIAGLKNSCLVIP